jgi:hypothetical protein
MVPTSPYDLVSLDGYAIMRGVTLSLPSEQVRRLLPAGLALGPQRVTAPGTHPVILLFNQLFDAHLTVPSLLPKLSYHEHTIGIPSCYLTGSGRGPFYFMPALYLDSFLATLGGVLYWGFAKSLASFSASEERYSVAAAAGGELASLSFRATDAFAPIAAAPHFAALRALHDQPLISRFALAVGPLWVCSNFEKDWSAGSIRSLETVLHTTPHFLQGVAAEFCSRAEPRASTSAPHAFSAPGIAESALGSYELRVPWRLSLPYFPQAAALVARRFAT